MRMGSGQINIEAMKELKITNMRWPGGNYAMAYNWQDGIGPKNKRPARINLAWNGVDTNHVGTDEWVALNRAIGSENVVCVSAWVSARSMTRAIGLNTAITAKAPTIPICAP
jgi:alpha-L-arabinofuranosidase